MTVGVGLRFWVEYLRSSVDAGELDSPAVGYTQFLGLSGSSYSTSLSTKVYDIW